MKDNEFLKMQLDYEKLVQDAEKGIIKNYSKAFKDLKKKLEKVYEMYEKDGQLTMDEMRKYGRLEKLEREAKLAVTELYKNNKKFINRSMRDIVKATEEKSFSIIDNKQSISPIKRSFDVGELINKAVAGRVWTERIDHYGSNFVYDIHTIIRQGIENGDTYTTTSKALKDKFGKEVGNTARIVRTESKRIQEFTAFKTMEEVDKEVKITKTWRTMKDGAVRSSHKKMEGITVGMDEEFTLPSGITTLYPTASGDPGEDINCRCYIEYNVEKEEEKGYNYNSGEYVEASPIFVSKSDDLYRYSKNIEPLDGYEDVVCHGDEISFAFINSEGKESNVSAEEFAGILSKTPTYKGGDIRLISCNAGREGGILAQSMANILKVNVLASTDIVYVYSDGKMEIANGGEWRLFKPKK